MVQIIENENFIKFADFDNYDVWLLNKVTYQDIDNRVINISEITESTLPNTEKLPKLLTEILNKYNKLDYQIITDDPKKYMIHVYVCDYNKFNIKELHN